MEWVLVPALAERVGVAGLQGIDNWALTGVCMELASVSTDMSVMDAWENAVGRVASETVQVLLNQHRQPMAVVPRQSDP